MGSCSSTSTVQQRQPMTTIFTQNPIKPEREDNSDQTHNNALEQAKREFQIKYTQTSVNRAQLEDFQLQRTIGTGSFARVMLVKRDNQFFALKIMEKDTIVKFKQVEHVLSEKQILQAINCPFVISLKYAFKDNVYLYLALEYVSGGEMFTSLRKLGKYPEQRARFYAAQIVLALEYMHYLNIIFRNIKPEDILFADDGYLKLTDFGFSKVTENRTYTLCGTPEYIAPEIIQSRGYNKSVDYWALGILIHEMTIGYPPFYASAPMELYEKIVAGTFKIPCGLSSAVSDLIKKFLKVNPLERYGCLIGGTKDIKNHKWFSSIDWIALGEKRLPAPFVPKDNEDYYEKYDEQPLKSCETAQCLTEFDRF